MTFFVGQKVVCIDADGSKSLKKAHVYTIKDILPARMLGWVSRRGIRYAVGIILVETTTSDAAAYGFAPERFRPAVERKTDISIFQRMLLSNKRDVSV